LSGLVSGLQHIANNLGSDSTAPAFGQYSDVDEVPLTIGPVHHDTADRTAVQKNELKRCVRKSCPVLLLADVELHINHLFRRRAECTQVVV